ncbi:MAG: aminoacyl-tRNA hydrolase [Candidatus Cloacimonetes bacterium]|nr:aminoacyl-tRNA hydrolase [Candidatus Cloacimonadota bacterium]
MKLVVGLGNPGFKYARNRHNIGFMVLDHLAVEGRKSFSSKTHYEYVAEKSYVLIKPRTYMNRSGLAVTSILSSYRITEILVISDDTSIPLGTMRFRHKGSAGGHNGLKSISTYLGTDEYKRFRIGVGLPETEMDLADYVLSNFSAAEEKTLEKTVQFASELLGKYLEEDFEAMLNHYSRNKSTYSEG